MNILPIEIQDLIINQVKCYCINICKTWEKILSNNIPNDDLITCMVNKDYYSLQFICFNFSHKLKDKDVINVANIMNDSLIFKIVLKTIYNKILPNSESILMYFRIDKINSDIINNIIKHIITKGNYKAFEYFIDIHNSSGFPDDLTYMSDINNIISFIKELDDYQFEHFIIIDYLMGRNDINWSEDDLNFITEILSLSFNKFYDKIKKSHKHKQNSLNFGLSMENPESKKDQSLSLNFIMLIDKLINKQNINQKKGKYFIKEHNIIIDKKAYLECIRHGLYNIIKNITTIEINNILINNDNQFIFFLLSLSGNCDLKNIIKSYHVDYHVDCHTELIIHIVDKLDIKERYNELLCRTKSF